MTLVSPVPCCQATRDNALPLSAALALRTPAQAIPWPTARDEAWRFSGLTQQRPEAYTLWDGPGHVACATDPTPPTAPGLSASCHLVLGHGGFRVVGTPAHGIQVWALAEALAAGNSTSEEVRAALNPEAWPAGWSLGGLRWLYWALEHARTGVLIDIPAGVVLNEPIVITYLMGPSGTVACPVSCVRLGQGARATLVEQVITSGPQEATGATRPACLVTQTHVALAPHAHLKRLVTHAARTGDFLYAFERICLQTQATLVQTSVHGGGQHTRGESQVILQGEGSRAQSYSASCLHGTQQLDQRTLQIHEAPGASSDLLYKNVLLDEAKSIFSGLIQVAPAAQKTDAYQKNRNLLLSPQAQSHALPGLEILANDVKCSHGATSSAPDLEELFYMASRGIPRSKAMQMLALGFLEEVLTSIEEPSCLDYAHRLIRQEA